MGQVCLETQIALAIQFLSIVVRSGSWRLFGSLKDVQLELEQAENMKWKMCLIGCGRCCLVNVGKSLLGMFGFSGWDCLKIEDRRGGVLKYW